MALSERFSYEAREWFRHEGDLRWRRVFPGRADQCSQGRRFVATVLADFECVSDAEWIAAELMSNALLHTRSGEPGGWFGVEVICNGPVWLAVRDLGGKRVPVVRVEPLAGARNENGRGLLGVVKLAAEFGFRGGPEEGHTVWARLPGLSPPAGGPTGGPVGVPTGGPAMTGTG